ncbi:Ubinuclein-2 [Schistosoma japonicum]|uniref:Ubinuclein-2 n=1 Tax=Schistosoma japonicum TaxID=6182 RepID=A0A4Z2DTA8_SCHJA|nr:Ubinuclein-2 [Schistosoma japonicum]
MHSESNEKTVVFEISLPDNEGCHECSYLELLQQHLESVNSRNHPDDPFASKEAAEEKKLSDLAKALERKYGTMVTMRNSGKQKRVRIDDFLDPGDGYDTQDSFIDDSEAIDVFVAPNISTKFGGYFVHQGIVEGLEDQSAKIEAPWNARILTSTKSSQNTMRRKNKSKELLDKAVKRLSTPSAFKPKLILPESRNQTHDADCVFNEVLSTPTAFKQSNNAKDMESCQIVNEKDDSDLSFVATKLSSEAEKTKVLPENLPPDIIMCLNNLIEFNKHGTQQRRMLGKPFDTELLKLDIKLKELMVSQSVRSDVFSYLESHLQLKHKAVMRRLKKLNEDKQEQRMNPMLDALGEAISSSMPPIIESYTKDKEVHLERIKAWQTENLQNGSDLTDNQGVNSSSDGNLSRRPPKPGPPKKIYRWNSECRQLFDNIVICRLESYKLLNIKGSAEDYLRRLFPTLIQLWPDGWISNAALWRTALPIFQKFCSDHGLSNSSSTSQSLTRSLNNNNNHSNSSNMNNGKNHNPSSSAHTTSPPDINALLQQNSPVVIVPDISSNISTSNISKTASKITDHVPNSSPRTSLSVVCSPKSSSNSVSVTKHCQSFPTSHLPTQPLSRPNFRVTPSAVTQSSTNSKSVNTKTPVTVCVDAGTSRLSYVLQSTTASVSPNSFVVPVVTSVSQTSLFNRTPILQNEAVINRTANTNVPLRIVSSSASNSAAAILVSKALQLNSELGKPTVINSVALKRQSYPQCQPSQQASVTQPKVSEFVKPTVSLMMDFQNHVHQTYNQICLMIQTN